MKKKTRLIEMYIGFTNHSWCTDYVEIPMDTPPNKIEKEARKSAEIQYKKNKDIAFIGLYNITSLD